MVTEFEKEVQIEYINCIVCLLYCRSRDSKNKELFEKMFPELRTKRDQLRVEAYSRYDMILHVLIYTSIYLVEVVLDLLVLLEVKLN